jgi:murein DD-endopeptidase / murein LD-carboxypeptidase
MYQKILACALSIACVALSATAVQAENELTPQDLRTVVKEAKQWQGTRYRYGGKDRHGIDCSHFVFAVYNHVFEGHSYRMAADYLKDPNFSVTSSPHVGDLIVFPGVGGASDHVGIITDVKSKKFIGSQSSTGVKETSYASGTYWGKRPYKILTLLSTENSASL